ncbi:MAG: bifunctional adenosylcobinamide kinase/adenosylcobinamide-phosphate guanylyltransferase [Acutalibacteraceae bacterium]
MLLFYLAPCANDTESKQRIERHRRMRADKSFQTIEVSKEIDSIAVPSDSVVLLECCPICWQTRCFQATHQSTLYPLYYRKSGICKPTASI